MSNEIPSRTRTLTTEDLLAGSQVVHEIIIPTAILSPSTIPVSRDSPVPIEGCVLVRPINITTLHLISRAARDDPELVPLLMIKEGLVEPAFTLDQIRQLHIGLVNFLATQVNRVSGLSADGETLAQVVVSPLGQASLLLAKHFGWTPEQVSKLTPGQVAVYLAGIEKLVQLEKDVK
jgi:hypothetical protein